MLNQVRYITNEQGEQIGVLLDIAVYQQLTAVSNDPEYLMGLSDAELHALAQSTLASEKQSLLDDLLAKNSEAQLSDAETSELDALLANVDQLTILKTRAKYTLQFAKSLPTAQ